MTNYINTSEIVNTLALAEFNTDLESLVEVTNDSFIIAVSAKKFTIKRYYIIGEMLYNNTISLTVETNNNEYTTKILVGNKEYPRRSDFITNISSVTYDNTQFKYLNALPVDILIESNTLSQRDCVISLNIGVE